MAISTFSDLKQSIEDHLDRPDLSSFIPDFLTIGENRVYRELRIRAMETAFSATISSGQATVPSDYLEAKHLYVNTAPTVRLERVLPEYIYERYPTRTSSGIPSYFAREAGNFIFGPYPDSSYTIKGVYYAKLTALSDSNTTNWFTTNSPEILIYAALCAAEKFIGNDDRVAMWNQMYELLKDEIQKQDDDEVHSGSGLRMVVV